MLVFRRLRSLQRVFKWFLASVVAAFAAMLVLAYLSGASDATTTQAAVGLCILLGLGWAIVGWLLAPSVETYLGQGALEGRPVIGARFANPERNRPVLADLAGKLSGETDSGIVLASLGFVLLIVGGLYYAMPPLGPMAVVAYLVGVFVLLLLAFLPSRNPVATA